MEQSHPVQYSFIGGEQSPLMDSSAIRVDKAPDAAASIENLLVTKDGPLMRRRGTNFVSNSVPEARIIPFLGDILLFGSVGGIAGLCIRSLSHQDDDLLVYVNGNILSNTRLNVAQYNGAQENVSNPSYLTTGFRELRFRRADSSYNPAYVKLFPFTLNWGDLVSVYTFDGWGNAYRCAPWEATIYFGNGVTRVVTGGSTSTGTSPFTATADPNYYTQPYHFEYTIPNGSFNLTY
jgi:hypothetical protein